MSHRPGMVTHRSPCYNPGFTLGCLSGSAKYHMDDTDKFSCCVHSRAHTSCAHRKHTERTEIGIEAINYQNPTLRGILPLKGLKTFKTLPTTGDQIHAATGKHSSFKSQQTPSPEQHYIKPQTTGNILRVRRIAIGSYA